MNNSYHFPAALLRSVLPLFVLFLLAAAPARAQKAQPGPPWTAENSTVRKAISLWRKDSQGLWHEESGTVLARVGGTLRSYAYDRENRTLFCASPVGNFAVWLTDEAARAVRRDKSLPRLKLAEIAPLVEQENAVLRARFDSVNTARLAAIAEARRKAVADSLARVRAREDSLRMAREREAQRVRDSVVFDLRAARAECADWRSVPLRAAAPAAQMLLWCPLCKQLADADTLRLLGISQGRDTLYADVPARPVLGIGLRRVHAFLLSRPLPAGAQPCSPDVLPGLLPGADDEDDGAASPDSVQIAYYLDHVPAARRHLAAWADSISPDTLGWATLATETRATATDEARLAWLRNALQKKAPSGYIERHTWGVEGGQLTFSFFWRNLASRTVKSIALTCAVTDGEGNVVARPTFVASGQEVAPAQAGFWAWGGDTSGCSVEGATAATLSFTRAVITYTDGTKKVLTEKQIPVNHTDATAATPAA